MRDDRTGTVMSKGLLPRYGLSSTACPGLGLIDNIYTLKEMTTVLTSRPFTMIYDHHSGLASKPAGPKWSHSEHLVWLLKASIPCATDCQQKRQQRCGESVGSGSAGVVLDSLAK